MGKKSRNQKEKFRSAMESLKGFGNDGRDTLSRLATTVKADAPTLILGQNLAPGGTQRNDGYASPFASPAPKSRISRTLSRLTPFKRSPVKSWNDRKAAKKLKKLAKQMATKGNNMNKIRRSRLPLVVALVVVAFGFAGYYTYRSVSVPKVHVTKYLDYKKWLNTTSGKAKPSQHQVASHKHGTKVRHASLRRHHSGKVAHHGKKHGHAKLASGPKSHKSHLAKLNKKHSGHTKLAKGKKAKKKKIKSATYHPAD